MSLKNIIRKSIASFGAILLVFSNCSLCGMGLLEVIAENASMPEIGIEWINEKYVKYNYNKTVEVEGQETDVEVKGVAIQSKLSVYPVYEQATYLPTENVEVSINLPSINGYLPEKSMVVEASTKATIGKENNTNINQNYDSNSGLLTVFYENTSDENENIYMTDIENAKDEFEIIYTYPAEAYTENEEETLLQNSANVKMTFKTENGSVTTENKKSFEIIEKDNKGDILTFGVTEFEKIYKGFMYSNVQNQTSYDTEYNTVSTFAVLNSEIVDELSMELKAEQFLLNDEQKTQVPTNGNVIYKSTKISKLEFDKILGQDGVLEIYTGETLLATVKYVEDFENEEAIKKLSVIYANGKIQTIENEEAILVEYQQNVSNLKINTTKPIAEGFIHFENHNVIKSLSDYGCKVEDIKYILTEGIVNENANSVEIRLLEPETKISVDSSNINFSTLQNSKTTLTITLDDTNTSAKLFNNPTITVKLPGGIVSREISNAEIVNGNGLTIKDTSVNKNIITIELEGKQTSYDLTNISGGASIVMDIENIDYNDTIPTYKDKIEVICTQGEEVVNVSEDVNIISRPGVLLLSKLNGFDNNNTVLTSIDSEPKTIEVEINAEQKEVLQTLNLINNYDDKISNVAIIGRIGYSKDQISSTFETELTKPIEIANGKVYYSTKTDATYNDESWREEFITNAKSYKVELENNELASKGVYEIRLHTNVPANLECNQENYLNCNVEYVYQERVMEENITIGMVTNKDELLTNYNVHKQNVETELGETIPVSVSITPLITQNYVHSRQIVTYKIKVTNNGQEDLENIKLTNNIPDNAIYTEYQEVESQTGNYKELVKDESIKQKEWTIDLLKSGDISEVEMLLTMSDVIEEQEIVNSVNMTYNDQTTENIESRLTLKPAKIQTTLTASDERILSKSYVAGETVNYYIKVKNITDKTLKDIKVQYKLPEEIEYIKGGIATYDEYEGYAIQQEVPINENLFESEIDSLKSKEEKIILIVAKVKQLTEKFDRKIESVAKVYLEGNIYETNVKAINIKQAMFEMSLNVDTKGKEVLSKNDEVIYTLTVKNTGENLGTIDILVPIPEELQVLEREDKINENTSTVIEYASQEVRLNRTLDEKDLLTVKITAKVRDIEVEKDTVLEAKNSSTLKMGELEINSNEVTINICPEVKVVEPEIEESIGNEENGGDDNLDILDKILSDSIGESTDDKPTDDKPTDDKPTDDKPTDDKPTDDKLTDDKLTDDKPTDDKPTDDTQADDDSKGETEETDQYYTISGIAWLDTNKDGEKNNSEAVLENISVTLVDKNTGKIAIDSNGNNISTKTNSNGKYQFGNLVKGNYAILFEFDTIKYTVTTYQKQGIDENKNSDAILSKVTINGENKNVGLTDIINLTANKENIDIGLIENATFDLCLDKEITKITVIDSKETKTYEFKEGHTAKVDLVAKYMNGANVIVNYKFTIINNGDITGYVNSLVDSLPSGLEFSSELNKDWYKGNDGRLYATSLSSKAIKPEESIEVELVLTKTMTTENAGTFVNNASLEKISNLENIQEKQETLEDNESSAILIISIKTGSIIMYIGITTVCLAIICIGAYLIKKKVLNRGI